MKKHASFGVAFAGLLLAFSTSGFATTINFDDIPGSGSRAVAGDFYKSLGVLLSSDTGGAIFAYGPAGDTNTPPTFVYGSSTGGSSADKQVIVDFVLPGTSIASVTDFVSFYAYDADTGVGSAWSAAVYDIGLSLLGTFSSSTNDEILVSFSTPGIHRLVFTPSVDLEGIDTLNFNAPGAVPEPGTVGLLAAGLLALAASKRLRGV